MTQATPDLNWLISVDDHVLEPGHLWQRWLPAKHRERGPRLEIDADGKGTWYYLDFEMRASGLSACIGRDKSSYSPEPLGYNEMRPGCYDPVARAEDMNEAGILASMTFPTFPAFCGQTFYRGADKELGLACIEAYNNWMIDEWCAAAPGRYIPLTLIPLWDPQKAAAEVRRVAARGVRAVAFSENPEPLGLPTINDPDRYWDPFFQAAEECGVVICMHVGSSSQIPSINKDTSFMANLSWGAVRTSGTMLDWLFSGVFERFPNLKISLAEGNIGWIPYFLERAEQVIDKQRYWVQRGVDYDPGKGSKQERKDGGAQTIDYLNFDIRQSFRDHVYGCFIDDIAGLRNLDLIGEDNVMIETDYPHSDSTWPHSIKLAHERLAGLPAETQYKILRGNAERLFEFTPADTAALPAPGGTA
ncbi:amidohydrolase family protein [Actinomadura sp. WAC 06369]|uniref:amidohydrolase family protein n=1 Tax=Actinomadura sp. WAC 06369 TaxID=2203193 RepID=UPI000F76671B|nr:amidohydrolase family protein [Actinomadura sp. WAC 06369]RSN66996.1 amidohydrolase [Actinomadura sp. WAC 06369]